MDIEKLKSKMMDAIATRDRLHIVDADKAIRDAGYEWVAELKMGTLTDNIDFLAGLDPNECFVEQVIVAPKGHLWE